MEKEARNWKKKLGETKKRKYIISEEKQEES